MIKPINYNNVSYKSQIQKKEPAKRRLSYGQSLGVSALYGTSIAGFSYTIHSLGKATKTMSWTAMGVIALATMGVSMLFDIPNRFFHNK